MQMTRRKMLTATGAATAVALAGCADGEPRKQCTGECDLLDEWSFEWDSNGIGTDTLSINFIVADDAPPLEVEFRGYEGEDLRYANTYEIDGPRTIIEEGTEVVERAEIEVSER